MVSSSDARHQAALVTGHLLPAGVPVEEPTEDVTDYIRVVLRPVLKEERLPTDVFANVLMSLLVVGERRGMEIKLAAEGVSALAVIPIVVPVVFDGKNVSALSFSMIATSSDPRPWAPITIKSGTQAARRL